MMEVQAAPSLQLFRDCAASTSPRTASGAASPSHQMSTSPLACSVDDISSQVLITEPHSNPHPHFHPNRHPDPHPNPHPHPNLSQLDRLSRTFHEQSSNSNTPLSYAAGGRTSPHAPYSPHSAAGGGGGSAPPRGASPVTLMGGLGSMGGPSSMALPAPYGVAISLRGDRGEMRGDGTSLRGDRGDVSPARPISRGARSSNNTHSSQHTSPATSPYGSPVNMDNFLGPMPHMPHMPHMHGAMPHMPHMAGGMPPSSHHATLHGGTLHGGVLRQPLPVRGGVGLPLPVIAEPSYADVARYAESGIHQQGQITQQGHEGIQQGQGTSYAEGSAPPSQLQRPQPRPSEHAEPPRGAAAGAPGAPGAAGAAGAPAGAAGAAGAHGAAPLVIEGSRGREGGEGSEGREGSDSTERLLLSSSPPSESLFPFAPTPNA